MAADIPNKQKDNIEIVFAFEKNTIDTSYMAGEHLKPLNYFNPTVYNVLMNVINPFKHDKNSSTQHHIGKSTADENN